MKTQRKLLAVVLVGAGLVGCSAAPDAPPQAPSALVQVQPVRKGQAPRVVDAYGTAAPTPDGSQTINVRSDGKVSQFYVVAGSQVERGQRLARFEVSPAALATYQQAQSAVSAASAQLQQTRHLYQDQLATQDQLAQSEKALADARETVRSLQEQQSSKPSLELTAPFAGVVASLSAGVGDALSAGATVMTLTAGQGVVAALGVEPGSQPQVGDKAVLHPLGAGPDVNGVVSRVGMQLNPRTRLIDVEVRPDAPLLPGMAYRGTLTTGQQSGWLSPRDAVVTGDEGESVFQVADGKAVRVAVQVVGESGQQRILAGQLTDRYPLVVVGANQLEDGMAVRLAEQRGAR